jgi:CRP/FNR family cyclic AMP-dependent transcriptional regulator
MALELDAAPSRISTAGVSSWRSPPSGRVRSAPLLDLDPDLGQLLDGGAFAAAQRTLVVRVARLPTGPWDADGVGAADAGHLGLLLVDGVIAHELLAEDVASMELLGPGDVLRPWQVAGGVELLRARVRWSVLADARIAFLDRELAARLARYPEIYAVIVERLASRSQRLTVTQAISHLNRVDRRLLTLFWHLAERWGRMTPDGVLVPLVLSHRTLAQLIGARRPTVSTALADLARHGELMRTPAGAWLLTGTPVGEPDRERRRLVPPRRQLLSRDEPAAAEA